jgi:sigma-54 dependent transcriptional regulator, acetoin dehydrogenase operon transcriptional activator AcoR
LLTCGRSSPAPALGVPAGDAHGDRRDRRIQVATIATVRQKGSTLSLVEVKGSDGPRTEPCLDLEVECERPVAGPARFGLSGLDELLLGRGAHRRARPDGTARLEVEVPDPSMSAVHVRLRRNGREWLLVDQESKNGTWVDGVRVQRTVLQAGTRFMVGRSFFRFWPRAGIVPGGVRDLESEGVGVLTTLSTQMAEVLEQLQAVAPEKVPVLLIGESGTGKEVLARTLHERSGRPGALVAVNCGGIPPNLVEAELFGHKKGAFSGADQDRPGLVKASDTGTLFLDEIGDLPLPAQIALLRVLQEFEVRPIGGHKPTRVDLRVIAATHHDLPELVRQGKFRHDLLARLEGVTLSLPPLRERTEDIPILIAALLERLAPEHPDVRLRPEAAVMLLEYSWPLNVRELHQVISGAVALSGAKPIDVAHLPPRVREKVPTESRSRELTAEERAHREELLKLLREHRGNLAAVARALGKGRTQVVRWVERYDIDVRALIP